MRRWQKYDTIEGNKLTTGLISRCLFVDIKEMPRLFKCNLSVHQIHFDRVVWMILLKIYKLFLNFVEFEAQLTINLQSFIGKITIASRDIELVLKLWFIATLISASSKLNSYQPHFTYLIRTLPKMDLMHLSRYVLLSESYTGFDSRAFQLANHPLNSFCSHKNCIPAKHFWRGQYHHTQCQILQSVEGLAMSEMLTWRRAGRRKPWKIKSWSWQREVDSIRLLSRQLPDPKLVRSSLLYFPTPHCVNIIGEDSVPRWADSSPFIAADGWRWWNVQLGVHN